MNATLSLPPGDDLDTTMRVVARNFAMGIYEIDKILVNCGVSAKDFMTWKNHPRFLAYLNSETEAWNSAHNTPERAKLKAAIIMEEWMADAYGELKDRKQPLNHRVELGKLVAKIAGMDSAPSGFGIAGQGSGGGFSLQINIAPGVATTINAGFAEMEEAMVIDEDPVVKRPRRALVVPEDPEPMPELEFEEDDFDPFTSPDTLDGIEED